MRQGEIWWASLAPPRGSGPGYRRPVLIVQQDSFNLSRINTVVVVILTSTVRLDAAPGNVFLPKERTALPRGSVANVSQVVTLDKSFLTARVGRLPPELLSEVQEGLKLLLGL